MVMARVTVEDCLQKLNNRFMLVHLASKRVIQLRKGAKPLVEAPKNKEIVLALREIAAGAVSQDNVTYFDLDQPTTQTTAGALEAAAVEPEEAQEALLATKEEPTDDEGLSSEDAPEGEEISADVGD
jgi:DNA-directed RNA polymerase subunit omega